MKIKACLNCKRIVEGEKCAKCESRDLSDSWKGRVVILDPVNSELAKNMKLVEKGHFAIKTK